jgi:YD repeat-containing protein
MGQALYGATAGQLFLRQTYSSPRLATPALLEYSATLQTNVDVEVIRTNGVLRQVKAPQTFADIVPVTDYKFEIRYYPLSQVGSKVNNLYQLSGSPFVTWTIENPDASPTLYDHLRITETRGAAVKQYDYTYTAANQSWKLSSPGGGREDELVLGNPGQDLRSETAYVRKPGGSDLYKLVRKYQKFDWGEGLIEVREGPDAAPRITTYTYHSGSGVYTNGGVQPIQKIIRPDGSWEWHEVPDSQGREQKIWRSFNDQAPTQQDSLCRSVQYSYAGVAPGDDGSLEANTPRTVIEKLLGQEISRSYAVIKTGERQEIQCQTPGAAWDATDNLVTVTKYYTTGVNTNRIQSIKNPDGTMVFYNYVVNGDNTRTTTMTSGQPNAGQTAVVDGTQTVTIVGTVGQMLSRTVTDIASSITLASETYSNYDEYNRPRHVVYLDGSSTDIQYACCGPDNTTDRDGTVTQYWYDALGRQIATTRLNITTTNLLDAAGNVLATWRIGTDLSVVTKSQTAYDLAGRVTSETNALGGVTTYVESTDGNGHLVRTTTAPDGGTRIETYFKDGQLKEISGTAANPIRYDYGLEQDGGVWRAYTKEIKVGSGGETTEWTKTYSDLLGRTYKTVYPDAAASQSFYNAQGQLSKQLDLDSVTTLYQHNAKGELEYTVLDLNRDGVIDWSGTDRITRTVPSALYNATVGANVRRTVTGVWTNDNQNLSLAVATNDVSTDGLRSWSIVWNG